MIYGRYLQYISSMAIEVRAYGMIMGMINDSLDIWGYSGNLRVIYYKWGRTHTHIHMYIYIPI